MKRKPDQYDAAIAYLRAHPEDIYDAWVSPSSRPAGCLFKFVVPPTLGGVRRSDGKLCGCLTVIRSCEGVAYDPSLTMPIRRDKKLPDDPAFITPAHLPRFAYWQRKLDKHWKQMEAVQ